MEDGMSVEGKPSVCVLVCLPINLASGGVLPLE